MTLVGVFALCVVLGFLGFKALAAAAALLAVANMLATRREIFIAGGIIIASILIDWYQLAGVPLALPVSAVLAALAFAALRFLTQSREHPWAMPPQLIAWGGLLLVGAGQILHGVSVSESITYFVNILLGSFVFCLLGTLIARDMLRVRQIITVLAGVAVVIALHSIIEARFGIFLFSTSRLNDYLTTVNDFQLAGSTTRRAASFLGNPDWDGAFLAMMAYLPLGLLVAARTQRARLLAALALGTVLVGLLFTYSTASWLALAVGGIGFVALLQSSHARRNEQAKVEAEQTKTINRFSTRTNAIIIGTIATALTGFIFRHQVGLLIRHATASGEVDLRLGAWLTGLRVIAANPLTGLGLGLNTYLQRAEPYRVALQYRPLAHPHNAYLELGALGGLPLVLLFLAVLVPLLAHAIRNVRAAQGPERAILAGGVAACIALSVNSLAINGWTLAPLAAVGWLLLGALASPLLRRHLRGFNSVPQPQPHPQQMALPTHQAPLPGQMSE